MEINWSCQDLAKASCYIFNSNITQQNPIFWDHHDGPWWPLIKLLSTCDTGREKKMTGWKIRMWQLLTIPRLQGAPHRESKPAHHSPPQVTRPSLTGQIPDFKAMFQQLQNSSSIPQRVTSPSSQPSTSDHTSSQWQNDYWTYINLIKEASDEDNEDDLHSTILSSTEDQTCFFVHKLLYHCLSMSFRESNLN